MKQVNPFGFGNGGGADPSMIAPVLSSFVATASIKNKGTQFVYNNTLYEITTTVTAGTAFVVGTNVKVADGVATQINSAQASDITSLLDTTYLNETGNMVTDTKIGKVHIIDFILIFKQSASTPGYVTFLTLPYNTLVDTHFSLSTWHQTDSNFMGVVQTTGAIMIAGINTFAGTLEMEGSCVVVEN